MTTACEPALDAASAERANTAALVAKLEAARDEVEALESTVAQLQGELDQRGAENAALKLQLETVGQSSADLGELVQAREEAQRYKEGLKRAVDLLNQRSGRPVAAAKPGKPAKPAQPAVFVRQPQAVVTNLDVAVEGTIHNAGSEVAVGYLELILWVDDRQDSSTTLTLEIAPRTVADYDWTFRNVIAGGQSARVEAVWGDFQP